MLYNETGALNTFFMTNGAGDYSFYLGFYNSFTDTAVYGELYLLQDTKQSAITEAPTWARMLLGFVGLGYAGCRRARPASLTA